MHTPRSGFPRLSRLLLLPIAVLLLVTTVLSSFSTMPLAAAPAEPEPEGVTPEELSIERIGQYELDNNNKISVSSVFVDQDLAYLIQETDTSFVENGEEFPSESLFGIKNTSFGL